MSTPLTPLAVQNRDLLEIIASRKAPETIADFAAQTGRDPANLRKTLRLLESEGWILAQPKGAANCVIETAEGQHALLALDFASGKASLEPPTFVHADLRPDPDQPRRDFESAEARKFLTSLAESIAERGLKQSILIRFDADGQALVVAGERRWRAIGQLIAAGDPRWPANRPIPHLLEGEQDPAEILATQVVENVQRAGLHPLEEAAAFKRLKDDHGWGVGQISRAIGRSRRFVEQRLDLLNLSRGLQDKMRLPKDHDDHLTVPRARELLAHMRQIAAGANEQRDIEEIAPADVSEEDINAARNAQLSNRELLALAEIAAAVAANPSTRFPHSPEPVVDVDKDAAIRSDGLVKLGARGLATFLIDADQAVEAAGVRIERLGHILLRLDKFHPADNPRALFHLRREVGLSADVARQLAATGRWATKFLNVETAKLDPIFPGEEILLFPDASPAELLALVEIRARCERKQHLKYGMARLFHPMPEEFERKFHPSWISTCVEHDGDERRHYVRLTDEAEGLLAAKRIWPAGFSANEAISVARAAPGAWTARALALGEYATEWLSFRGLASKPEVPVQDPAAPAASWYDRFGCAFEGASATQAYGENKGCDWHSPRARLILLELAHKCLCYPSEAGEGWTELAARPSEDELAGLHGGIIELSGEALDRPHAKLWFTAGIASASGGIHGSLTRLGFYPDGWGAIERARAELGVQPAPGAKYATQWLNAPKPAIAYWTPPAPAQADPESAVGDAGDASELSIPEENILRQVDHAQAANGGEPVVVGRYWLDADAVALWKRTPASLIEFKAEPLQSWTVSLTEAGRAELAKLGPAATFSHLMAERDEHGEGYSSAWLNPPADEDETPAEQAPDQEPAADEPDTHADTLATVRAKLAEGAPNFAELLQLAGLPGKITVSEDGVLSSGSTPTDIAVDPWRDGSDQLAQAQAELIAWALNFAAGHIEAPAAAGDDLVDQVLRTGSALRDVLALRIDPTTPVWFEVCHAYEPFAKASNALAWRRERAGREEKPEPLLTFNRGDLVTIGGTASGYRLLEPNRPGDNFGGIFPSFLAQQVNLKNGKDYGQPRSISLHAIQGFIKDPDRYLGRTKTEAA